MCVCVCMIALYYLKKACVCVRGWVHHSKAPGFQGSWFHKILDSKAPGFQGSWFQKLLGSDTASMLTIFF